MKRVSCPLFDKPIEITHALIAVASQENHDGYEYDLMMEAADHIRALEAKIDSLYEKLTEREKLICNLPYGSYSWFHLAPQDDICVTHTVNLGDNNDS